MDKSGFNPVVPGHSTDHDLILREEPRTVKKIGAGISLPYEVRLEMALHLDDHQCALTVALHQYNKHHWMTEGAEAFLSLHELLNEHREKTNKHIDQIGERVARLGGVPTAHPVTQHELSYIKHEVEGRYTIRDFIRNDLEHELKLQQMMRKTISRAHELKDWGTAEVLQEVVLDREDLGYHLYSVLEDDTLVRGMGHLLDGKEDRAGDRPMDPGTTLQ
ncbi:Dps family protein [Paenactinomyces guangxiensis]|uniref:Ferritin-like domain-containing protein n=1 Tax=Paenactinomyces guangxiensis TaxID=1490290 RepID=A0A7W2A6F0_9BACL|nr:ferritin-like domain-containing protein [Paenactinomyces guangxiensis]MBA4493306.1 ferritin-like domain-containing protein [Paenactinomyces guangxiensis]MBH8589843.1 ferritin-like domain-containing protein [Paenactinomyces guangxiensis]